MMENIINQIINIEDKAQKIMSDAENLEKSLSSDIDDKIKNIKSDIETRVTNKYKTIQNAENQYADNKIKEIKSRYAEAAGRLEENFNQNKDRWVNEIFESIISGE